MGLALQGMHWVCFPWEPNLHLKQVLLPGNNINIVEKFEKSAQKV